MAAASIIMLAFYFSLYLSPGKEDVYHPRRQFLENALLKDAELDEIEEAREAKGHKLSAFEKAQSEERDRNIAVAIQIGLDAKAYLTCVALL